MMGMGMAVWVRADCAAGRAAGLCEGRAGSTLGGGEEVQADRGAAARGGGQTLAGAKQSAVFSSIATYIHTYIHTPVSRSCTRRPCCCTPPRTSGPAERPACGPRRPGPPRWPPRSRQSWREGQTHYPNLPFTLTLHDGADVRLFVCLSVLGWRIWWRSAKIGTSCSLSATP